MLQKEGMILPTFQIGDVFVGIGNGLIAWYRPDGTFVQNLDSTTGSLEMTGMAFDSAGNLYATAFQAQRVAKFDTQGNFLGLFGSGYNADPESMIFNAAGEAFVGQADGTRHIKKFDAAGNFIRDFVVATQDRGSDWIDLDPNQCIMFYTSEGTKIFQYDVCADMQLPDINVPAANTLYALRQLPNGEFLVANTTNLLRLDASGNLLQTYDTPNPADENFFFAMNLDPDGTSFWTAGYSTFNVYKFDIATGNILTQFKANGLFSIAGLAIFGERMPPPQQGCPVVNKQSCCQVVIEKSTQLMPPARVGTASEEKVVVAGIEKVCPEKVVICGVVRKTIRYVDENGNNQTREDDVPFQCVIDREDANEGDTFHIVGADILCTVFAEEANFNADRSLAFKWIEKEIVKVCIRKGPPPADML